MCLRILCEANDKLGRLGVKTGNQAGNQESLESIKIMIEILKEFANKIKNCKIGLDVLTKCDGIAFITENISIDYENGSIDYNAFIGAFHEFKTLYPLGDSCNAAKKRCEKLKKLIRFYSNLIVRSKCSLLFDFDNSEELIFLVSKSLKDSKITVTSNNKRTSLVQLYEEVLSNHSNFITSCGPLLMGRKILEVSITNSEYLLKNYFFTKLSNYFALRDDYGNVLILAGSKSEDFSRFGIWEFKAMSMLELYLNSPKDKWLAARSNDKTIYNKS